MIQEKEDIQVTNEVLVKVENLSKKFCKDLKTSLWYGVKDLVSGVRGNTHERTLRPKEFWAVKDVSFELRRGECLGLIGHNGAGKSTLLKILNGLINPDAGTVTIKGRVGALIELGAGFNPILTGRENIYNNGAVLGFTKEEVDAKLDEIISFSELEEFIDMPVQHYSSGMKVRLGFAVASQMEPDVLLIDEVLAVGDVSFRAKCYERISELMSKCCVIFVTHSMPQVSKICTRSILMHKGLIKESGDNGKVIEAYYDDNITSNNVNVIYDNYCKLKKFTLAQRQIENYCDEFKIEMALECMEDLNDVAIDIVFMSRELVPIAQFNSKITKKVISLKKGVNSLNIVVRDLGLNVGLYKLSCNVSDRLSGKQYMWIQNITELKVVGDFVGHCPIMLQGELN